MERNTVRPRFGGLVRSLIVSVAIPLILVQVLLRRGMPAVPAFAIAAIFPLVESSVALLRERRFDLIAVLSLIAILAGIGTAGLSGNPAFAVAKESVVTFVLGGIFLGSLLGPRPLGSHAGSFQVSAACYASSLRSGARDCWSKRSSASWSRSRSR